MNTETVEAEVLPPSSGYLSLDELRFELLIWRNFDLSRSRVYPWRDAALISKNKVRYTARDRAKLFFLHDYMYVFPKDRNLERASAALAEALENEPEKFPQE